MALDADGKILTAALNGAWSTTGGPVILGMPLYARPSWKQYRQMVAENPEYAYLDHVASVPLESYYNGLNTLREKTFIAMKKAGGVMLFDVNEDTDDETSVVAMIHDLQSRTAGYSREELKNRVTVMDTKAVIMDGGTYIPLRAVFSAFGYDLAWHGSSNTVYITKTGN